MTLADRSGYYAAQPTRHARDSRKGTEHISYSSCGAQGHHAKRPARRSCSWPSHPPRSRDCDRTDTGLAIDARSRTRRSCVPGTTVMFPWLPPGLVPRRPRSRSRRDLAARGADHRGRRRLLDHRSSHDTASWAASAPNCRPSFGASARRACVYATARPGGLAHAILTPRSSRGLAEGTPVTLLHCGRRNGMFAAMLAEAGGSERTVPGPLLFFARSSQRAFSVISLE